MPPTNRTTARPYASGDNIDANIVNSATGYRVNGTTVVGAQGAAITDLDLGTLTLLSQVITGMAAVEDKINAIIGAMRTHGAIAP